MSFLLGRAFFLRRFGKRLGRDLDQLAEPRAILPPILGYQHARLATGVGFFHGDVTGKGQPRVGRFNQKAIVANHGDEDVVAIDTVFAEHLPRADCSGGLNARDDAVGGGLGGWHIVFDSR